MFALGLAWQSGLAVAGAQTDNSINSINPIKGDLEHLGRNLERERMLYERLQRESTSLLQTLVELDQEVDSSEHQLRSTEERLADLERQLDGYRRKRQQAARSLDELRGRLGRRLRRLYMQGEVGWPNLVFGSGSISEGLQRHDVLKRLALADRQLARDVARSRDLLRQAEQRIQEQKAELESVRKQVRKRRERAALIREDKLAALDLVKKKKDLRKRALAELKQARGRLSSLVSSIEGKATAAGGFASWRGRLPAPVAGGRVEVKFGKQVDQRFGTVTMHQGVDIRAPGRKPVRAIYPARVVFADVFQGYGRLVILDHGGSYYTLYAHMDGLNVVKGQRVEQGEPVGTLGASGSLKGPYLYFEVRKRGRAVDPARWVRLDKR